MISLKTNADKLYDAMIKSGKETWSEIDMWKLAEAILVNPATYADAIEGLKRKMIATTWIKRA